MASIVNVTLKREQKLGRDFKPVEETGVKVYINCDGLSSCIGYADNEDEVMELIAPENIQETLNKNLSCDEIEVFDSILRNGTVYHYYDKELIYTT